jgi:organic radical activating enzyme
MRLVTIFINKRCPLRCRHCSVGFSESFHGSTFRIREEDLVNIIEGIDPSIYKLVVFGGGEPSLAPSLIKLGVDTCRKSGLLSGIVTAPIWSSSPARAKAFLDRVCGLTDVILSYDSYHLEFLKFAHYENAVREAFQRGIRVGINLTYSDESEKQPLIDSLGPLMFGISYLGTSRAVPIGNASVQDKVGMQYITITAPADLDAVPRGCILGKAYVDEDLRVHGCCYSCTGEHSPFSFRGNGSPIASIFQEMETDPLFQSVLKKGFLGSLSPAGKQLLFHRVQGQRFGTECDLCVHIMKKDATAIWQQCVNTD